mgnify:CR=1 FL=1|jgi:hypothetical protein
MIAKDFACSVISIIFFQLQDATDNDGNKGSGEENASEGVSDTLGNLKV